MLFTDRREAGKKLAAKMLSYADKPNTIALGLARGGLVVAAELAKTLHIPFDVLVVKKVGAPENEELAIGAVTEYGDSVLNDHLIALLGVSNEYLKKEVQLKKESAETRSRLYRAGGSFPDLKHKTVILVDDGIATGASMKAAILSMKGCGAARIVVAVPVASPDAVKQCKQTADEVICLSTPEYFYAVGAFYKLFDQTTDDEVAALLKHQPH